MKPSPSIPRLSLSGQPLPTPDESVTVLTPHSIGATVFALCSIAGLFALAAAINTLP